MAKELGGARDGIFSGIDYRILYFGDHQSAIQYSHTSNLPITYTLPDPSNFQLRFNSLYSENSKLSRVQRLLLH